MVLLIQFFAFTLIEELSLESFLECHPVQPLAQSRAVTDYSWHCSVVMKISMTFLKLSAVCYRFLFSPYCSTLTLRLPFLAVVFMGSCSEPDQEVKQAENWWLSSWIHFFSPAAHIPKNILDVAICLVVKQDWQKQTNSHNRGLWMLLEYRYLFMWYGRVGTYGTKVVPKKVIHYGTNLQLHVLWCQ